MHTRVTLAALYSDPFMKLHSLNSSEILSRSGCKSTGSQLLLTPRKGAGSPRKHWDHRQLPMYVITRWVQQPLSLLQYLQVWEWGASCVRRGPWCKQTESRPQSVSMAPCCSPPPPLQFPRPLFSRTLVTSPSLPSPQSYRKSATSTTLWHALTPTVPPPSVHTPQHSTLVTSFTKWQKPKIRCTRVSTDTNSTNGCHIKTLHEFLTPPHGQ